MGIVCLLNHILYAFSDNIFERNVFKNQFLSTTNIMSVIAIVDIFCSPFASFKMFLLYGWAIQKFILWSWERFTLNTLFGRHVCTWRQKK